MTALGAAPTQSDNPAVWKQLQPRNPSKTGPEFMSQLSDNFLVVPAPSTPGDTPPMVLLTVILAILFPLAPVAQLIEGVRHVLACFVRGFEDKAYLEELRGDYAQLAELDRVIADMESILHIVIWHMARFKLGLPYREHRRTGRARPGNRLTLEKVQARLQRACQMLSDLERMAVRRAWRLKRLLDANPLGLADHRPATPPSTTTTIFRGVRQKSSANIPAAGQRIRGPPWRG
mgnify:CR=1 FL=1